MKIIYHGGEFFCDADKSAQVMTLNKWKWDGEYWTTRAPSKVLPLLAFCSTAAKSKVETWQKDVVNTVADSFATSSTMHIPSPDGLEYLDFQKAGIEYSVYHTNNILIADPPGLGKAQPLYSKVLSPTGWRKMGTLKVGDLVCNPTGGVQWVSGVFDQGEKQNYKVTFHDGSSTECCDEHLWLVGINGEEYEVRELTSIIKEVERNNIVTIPTVAPPTFTLDHTLMVEPYLFGVILASGVSTLSNGNILISCETNEQVDSVLAALMMIPSLVDQYTECKEGVEVHKCPATAFLIEAAETWGYIVRTTRPIDVYSHYYEALETEIKYLILQGYFDWCGIPMSGYKVNFIPRTEQGKEVIRRIVMSVGGIMWRRGDSDYVSIPNDRELFITSLQDEFNTLNDDAYVFFPERTIVSIKKLGMEKMRCIRVSGPDHLYITDEYIVTHNTIQAIGYSNALGGACPTLIICPATLKQNWEREWKKWDCSGFSVGICDSKTRTRTVTEPGGSKTVERWREDIFPNTDVVIVNYEQLEKFDLQIKLRRWALVIIDEADRLANTQTKVNKCVFGGVHTKKVNNKKVKTKFKKINSDKIIYLTGTPIRKSPINLWPIIQDCDKSNLGRNWKTFVYRYCEAQNSGFGLDTTGASNLEELNFKMRKAFMVRRDKKEVLKDLPDKRREIIFLPSEGLTKHVERELSSARRGMHEFEKMMGLAPQEDPEEIPIEDLMEFMEEFSNRFMHLSHEERVQYLANTPLEIAFEEFAEARQQLSIAKIPMIRERINRALEEEECIVFFGIHTDFIETLAKDFDNYAMITGRIPVKKRQAQVDYFQNDTDCRIFFGNIQAAGVGNTLTRASRTLFGELPWNETETSQAEDRTWRIGQKNACLAQHLIVHGSMDARFVEVNWNKGQIAEAALDAKKLDPSKIFSQSVQF